MSPAALSLFVYGLYIGGGGVGMILFPGLILAVIGLPQASEAALRFVGVLGFALGFYDVLSARAELVMFFRWSVFPRCVAFFVFSTLFALGQVPPAMLLIGVVDLLAAGWTWWALRASRQRP